MNFDDFKKKMLATQAMGRRIMEDIEWEEGGNKGPRPERPMTSDKSI